MLTKQYDKIKLLNKEFNKLRNEEHSFNEHHPLFKNDKKIESISVSFSKLEAEISIYIPFSIEKNTTYLAFHIAKENNEFLVENEIKNCCFPSHRSLINSKNIREEFLDNRYSSIEEKINNLKEESRINLLIAEHLEFLKEEVNKSAKDIFNFYCQFINKNVNKKEDIKKEIEEAYIQLSNLYNSKIAEHFSIDNSSSFNDFILEQANCNSIEELKEKYNNKDPIYLNIIYSNTVKNIVETPKYFKDQNIMNPYTSNQNFLQSELIILYIKNNKLFFRSCNVNRREEAENIFNSRVLFKGKPCKIDTVVQLENGENYQFFLEKEDSSHVAFSKPNNEKEILFNFLDNI